MLEAGSAGVAGRSLELAEQIRPADDSDERVVSEHRDATVIGCGDECSQLGERRVLPRAHHVAAHDPADGSMREVVPDCLVQVLAADAAHEAAVLHDEDAALAVPLAKRHRVPDGRPQLDRSRRGRHDVPCRAVAAGGLFEDVEHAATHGLEAGTRDRRRRLRMATATERSRDGGRVERLRTTPNDDEHALVHLDEQHERTGVREVDDLVREVRHAVDVLGPLQRSDEDLLAVRDDRLQALHQGLEQLPLTRSERRVQVLVHELLARAVADTPRQGVDVALRRRRVRERARVLVDAESERRRLQGRRLQLALRDDADERRRECAVGREHARVGRHPLGHVLLAVVVEEHRLDIGVERDRFELAET